MGFFGTLLIQQQGRAQYGAFWKCERLKALIDLEGVLFQFRVFTIARYEHLISCSV